MRNLRPWFADLSPWLQVTIFILLLPFLLTAQCFLGLLEGLAEGITAAEDTWKDIRKGKQ